MRIAIVGAGRWGAIHCQKVKLHPVCRLVGVVDCKRDKALALAGQFDVMGFDQIQSCAEADAFIIATPMNELEPCARQVLALGKRFLVEKPFSIDAKLIRVMASEYVDILNLGRVGYQLRCHPELRRFREQSQLFFSRTEPHFSNMNDLLDDCGVHELDLAVYLCGGALQFLSVEKSLKKLEASFLGPNGQRIDFRWRIGANRVRKLETSSGSIDFVSQPFDLLSLQLDDFVRDYSNQTQTGASVIDALSVAEMLAAIKGK